MRRIALLIALALLLTACAAQPAPAQQPAAVLSLNDYKPFEALPLSPGEFMETLAADRVLSFAQRTDAFAALGLSVPPPQTGDMQVWQEEVNVWTTLNDEVHAEQTAYAGTRAQYAAVRMVSADGALRSDFAALFERAEGRDWQLIDLLPGLRGRTAEVGQDTLFVLYPDGGSIALYDPALRATVALWRTADCPDGDASCHHTHLEHHMVTDLTDLVNVEEQDGEVTLTWFTFYDREDGQQGEHRQVTRRRADGTWEQLPSVHLQDAQTTDHTLAAKYPLDGERTLELRLLLDRTNGLVYAPHTLEVWDGETRLCAADLSGLPEGALAAYAHGKFHSPFRFADLDLDGSMDVGLSDTPAVESDLSGAWWRWDPQTQQLEYQFSCFVDDNGNWIDPARRTVTYACRCGGCDPNEMTVRCILEGGGLEKASAHP